MKGLGSWGLGLGCLLGCYPGIAGLGWRGWNEMQMSSVRSRCLRVRNESDEDEQMWYEPPRKRTGRNPGNNRVGGGHQELLAIVRGLQRSNILRGERAKFHLVLGVSVPT